MREVLLGLACLSCVEAARPKPVRAVDIAPSPNSLAQVSRNGKDTLNPFSPVAGRIPKLFSPGFSSGSPNIASPLGNPALTGFRPRVSDRRNRLRYRAPAMNMENEVMHKTIHTLNTDLAQILHKSPDLSIYTQDLELDLESSVAFLLMKSVGASAPKIQGLPQIVGLLQKIVHFGQTRVEWDEVKVKTRLARDSRGEHVIESNWTAQIKLNSLALAPWILDSFFGSGNESSKYIFGFDAGSKFHVNSEGKIYRHVIDTADVSVNNEPIEIGVLEALLFEGSGGRAVYNTNRKRAFDTLYNDIPQILRRLPNMDVYTPDIELDFQSPVATRLLEASGEKLTKIKGLIQMAEFFGKLQLFGQTMVGWDEIEVLSAAICHDDECVIDSDDDPDAWNADLDDDIIECNWIAKLGLKPNPALPQLGQGAPASDAVQAQRLSTPGPENLDTAVLTIDIQSRLYLNSEAKIFRHVIEMVALSLNDKPVGMPTLDWWVFTARGASDKAAGSLTEAQD